MSSVQHLKENSSFLFLFNLIYSDSSAFLITGLGEPVPGQVPLPLLLILFLLRSLDRDNPPPPRPRRAKMTVGSPCSISLWTVPERSTVSPSCAAVSACLNCKRTRTSQGLCSLRASAQFLHESELNVRICLRLFRGTRIKIFTKVNNKMN